MQYVAHMFCINLGIMMITTADYLELAGLYKLKLQAQCSHLGKNKLRYNYVVFFLQ